MVDDLLINGVVLGAAYAITALGFALVLSTCRFFNISHGVMFSLGAYFCYEFTESIGWPLPISVLAACLLTSVTGAAIFRIVYYPLRKRGGSDLVLFLASLALYIILQSTLSLVWGDEAKSMAGFLRHDSVTVLSVTVTLAQLWVLVIAPLSAVVLAALLRFTRLGKLLRAASESALLLELSGAKIPRILSMGFAIASFLSALAGILVGIDTSLSPSMGFSAVMISIAAAIAAGPSNVLRIVIIGIFLGIIQSLSVIVLPSRWQEAIVFLILLLIVVMRNRISKREPGVATSGA